MKVTTLRQRLEQHRASPSCAGCHKLMDPIGLTLENFDHTGKWRTVEAKMQIDATGQLTDGTKLDGPESLRRALLARSDVFVTVLARDGGLRHGPRGAPTGYAGRAFDRPRRTADGISFRR